MGEALMPRRGGGIKAHGFAEGMGDVLAFVSPAVVKHAYVRLVDPVEDVVVGSDISDLPAAFVTEFFLTRAVSTPPTGPATDGSITAAGCTNFLDGDRYAPAVGYGGIGLEWGDYDEPTGRFCVYLHPGECLLSIGSVSSVFFYGTYEYFIFD